MTTDAISSTAARAASAIATGGDPRSLTRLPADEQVKAAAGQFEAILIRQFLEKSVGNILGGESGGPGASVYGFMLTDVLANQLTAGGGLGLGRILEHQLSPRAPLDAAAGPQETHP
jgi:flagellar protein FlgJ